MSDAYDCCCDYDQPTLYSARIARARKTYRCEECPTLIQPGQRYERVFGICEGDTFEAITCEGCLDLRMWVRNNVPCTCWAHGNLHEDLRASIEAAVERAPDETRGLRFGFLRRLFQVTRKRRAAT